MRKTINDIVTEGNEHLKGQGEALNIHYGDSDAKVIEMNPDEDVNRLENERQQLEKLKSEIRKYNDNFHVLDPKYSKDLSITSGKILLRMKRKEVFTKDGILIGQEKFAVQGQNGQPEYHANPFSFELKGVIVNKRDNEGDYQIGDIVQVHPDATKVSWKGYLDMPFMFMRWDAYNDNPENMMDHFGYILIPPHLIDCKVNA
jgi:hypothetical protein